MTTWLTRVRRRMQAAEARVTAGLTRRRPLQGAPTERSLVDSSTLVAALERVAALFGDAWRTAAVRRRAEAFLVMPLPARVQAIGCALVAAVSTHVVVMMLVGVQVRGLGWTVRAAMALAGVMAACGPQRVAAAWRERRTAGDGR